jgi:hypothetical protein
MAAKHLVGPPAALSAARLISISVPSVITPTWRTGCPAHCQMLLAVAQGPAGALHIGDVIGDGDKAGHFIVSIAQLP